MKTFIGLTDEARQSRCSVQARLSRWAEHGRYLSLQDAFRRYRETFPPDAFPTFLETLMCEEVVTSDPGAPTIEV